MNTDIEVNLAENQHKHNHIVQMHIQHARLVEVIKSCVYRAQFLAKNLIYGIMFTNKFNAIGQSVMEHSR